MAAQPSAPKKGRRKLVWLIVCVVCIAGGAVVPMVAPVPQLFAKPKETKKPGEGKSVIIPFGEVVVNLTDERMQRYLKLKVAVVADPEAEKELTDLLAKQKPAVKSKLISHLAGKTVKDVSGTVGVNRLQRELLERFEDVLYPDGGSRIRAVVFEEYIVQ